MKLSPEEIARPWMKLAAVAGVAGVGATKKIERFVQNLTDRDLISYLPPEPGTRGLRRYSLISAVEICAAVNMTMSGNSIGIGVGLGKIMATRLREKIEGKVDLSEERFQELFLYAADENHAVRGVFMTAREIAETIQADPSTMHVPGAFPGEVRIFPIDYFLSRIVEQYEQTIREYPAEKSAISAPAEPKP